jgi:hypothetical protein
MGIATAIARELPGTVSSYTSRVPVWTNLSRGTQRGAGRRAGAAFMERASPPAPSSRLVRTTNDRELERHDDTFALPSEEQCDPGQRLLDSS